MRSNRFEIFSAAIGNLVKNVQNIKTRKMAEYQLKGTNAICLCQVLESADGLTATELAQRGEIDKAQVSRCMAELSEKGYIYRDDHDGRRYKQKYRLTEAGRAVAEDVKRTTDLIQSAVSKNISDEELEIFYKTLYKLCDNFDELLHKM